MRALEHPDSMYLLSAIGWLELGNYLEANEELERIAPPFRSHPEVLEARWHIYCNAEKWEVCVDIGRVLVQKAPERLNAWILRSSALHELKRTQEAFEQLLPAIERWSEVWTIPYNLACYCARLGRMEECEEWFTKAMDLDAEAVRKISIDDQDLKPLWERIGGLPGDQKSRRFPGGTA